MSAADPLAMEKHKTLIISTATVALQEQIISKDLPEIQARAGLSFSYAMAKGRSRYFCQMRCDVHMESEMNAYGYIRDDVEDISKAFAGGHWTGERDSYPDEINEAVWGRVNAIGSQCPKSVAHIITVVRSSSPAPCWSRWMWLSPTMTSYCLTCHWEAVLSFPAGRVHLCVRRRSPRSAESN